MKQNRVIYFDILRILACILVVLVHVSGEIFNTADMDAPIWQLANFYNCIGIMGVPIFFMLSGALLLNPSKKISANRFFFRSALPLMGYYFVTITLYDLVHFFIDEPVKDFAHFKENVLLNIACGSGIGVGHLWFILILFSIYLITPIVKPAFEKEENCRYFLILFFLIAVLAHSLLLLPLPYKIIWQSLYGLTPFYLILTYMGYCVLGHYIHAFVLPRYASLSASSKKKRLLASAVLFLLGTCLTVFSNSYACAKAQAASTITNEPYFLGHFMSAFGLFGLLGMILYGKTTSHRWLGFFSRYTLGVYLLHPLMMDLFDYFGANMGGSSIYRYMLLSTLFMTVASLIPTALIVLFKSLICTRKSARRSS